MYVAEGKSIPDALLSPAGVTFTLNLLIKFTVV